MMLLGGLLFRIKGVMLRISPFNAPHTQNSQSLPPFGSSPPLTVMSVLPSGDRAPNNTSRNEGSPHVEAAPQASSMSYRCKANL